MIVFYSKKVLPSQGLYAGRNAFLQILDCEKLFQIVLENHLEEKIHIDQHLNEILTGLGLT